MSAAASRAYGIVLAGLAGIFLLRVSGQLVVLVTAPAFLPPFEEWDSGLLPYPVLLAAQLAILAAQALVVRDFLRGSGWFVWPHRKGARALRAFAWLYAGAMAARYVATMALFPDRRWLTGTIPIWFHFVLAAFLLVYCRFHRRAAVAQIEVAPIPRAGPATARRTEDPEGAGRPSRSDRDTPGSSVEGELQPLDL